MRRRDFLTSIAAASVSCVAPVRASSPPLPIFDAHIHYSHDAWDRIPPKAAVEMLRKAGVRRALVSSANDDGTLMLLKEAPDMIVPELSPYRKRGEFDKWMRDPGNLAYVEARLGKVPYVSIGEFHIYGRDAELPIVRRIVALARQHKLLLHAHADAAAVEVMFKLDPAARILWAHAGFERLGRVLELLRGHRSLWCDLAVRGDPGGGSRVDPDWRKAFEEFPDRFMLGTDTYTPERWSYIASHADWARGWLADLPRPLAEAIAFANAETLFPPAGGPTR
jgi:hypothetical protein